MQFKQLLTDNDAVSPVIGVILMVAITVILAAVIGTFVLGLGDQVSDSSPTASFTFEQGTTDFTDDADTVSLPTVEITHDGGDSIARSDLEILVNGNRGVDILPSGGSSLDDGDAPFAGSGDVTAGTSVEVEAMYTGSKFQTDVVGPGKNIGYATGDPPTIDAGTNIDALSSDDTIRVVWSSSSGGDTATLGKFTLS